MFKLIIVFMLTFNEGMSVSPVNTNITYKNMESCDSAGRQAVNNYQEGSVLPMPRIAWLCVETTSKVSSAPAGD